MRRTWERKKNLYVFSDVPSIWAYCMQFACGLVLLTACGGDATSPVSRFAGLWTAASVAGKPLPAVIQIGTTSSLTIARRSIDLDPSGTLSSFNDSVSVSVTINGHTSVTPLVTGGFVTWTAMSDTSLRAVQKSPCLCVGPMWVTQDFYIQRDGSLTANFGEGVTVFRR